MEQLKEVWKPGNMLYPVPVVIVSCGRPGERPNIITVAWAGTVCSDPGMVSVSVRQESPVNLECRVSQVLELGSHDMFLAEVVGVTVDKAYMDEKGKFHLNDTGLVAYSHGEYFLLGEKLGKFGYSVQKKGRRK